MVPLLLAPPSSVVPKIFPEESTMTFARGFVPVLLEKLATTERTGAACAAIAENTTPIAATPIAEIVVMCRHVRAEYLAPAKECMKCASFYNDWAVTVPV